MMPLRINVKDLSTPANDLESPIFLLTYKNAGQKYCHPLDEGEMTIGSSPLCSIPIPAPGIRPQHVSLKRQGNRIYIRGIGKSPVRIHGREIKDSTPIAAGEPFTMGAITAVVEYISPEDQKAAVQVSAEKVKALIEDPGVKSSRIITDHLKELNHYIDRHMNRPGTNTSVLLMDILRRCFQPDRAVLACRKGDSEWTILAEMGSDAVSLPEALEEPSLYSRWDMQADDMAYCLLVRFPDGEEEQPWQYEFCRIVLSVSILSRDGGRVRENIQGEKAFSAESEKEPDTPFSWDRTAGSLIRSHLSRQTEMLRHSDIVLIIGETGTGKELAARSLHDLWQQKGDFVAINCAAIPADLLDSELFGVTSGAATGVSARQGRFAQAQGGTLFLDEISEMPLPLQSKLLRVLQEKEYYPVGGRNLEKTDVRVIASSNQNEEILRSGQIRQDLYFRLSRAVVFMPPLRERLQDMAELCGHILSGLEHEFGRNIKGLSIAALEGLKTYDWPGNIRELQNLLRNLYMSVPEKSLIRSPHLPDIFQKGNDSQPEKTLAAAVRDMERKLIMQEMGLQGSVREAAKRLGLSEGYLYRKIKKLGIK